MWLKPKAPSEKAVRTELDRGYQLFREIKEIEDAYYSGLRTCAQSERESALEESPLETANSALKKLKGKHKMSWGRSREKNKFVARGKYVEVSLDETPGTLYNNLTVEISLPESLAENLDLRSADFSEYARSVEMEAVMVPATKGRAYFHRQYGGTALDISVSGNSVRISSSVEKDPKNVETAKTAILGAYSAICALP